MPDSDERSVVGRGQDVWELLVAYAKQETVEPLRGLQRWVAARARGSFFLSPSVSLLLLACLRALQTETGTTFTGNWSWAPYLITLVGAALVIGVSFWAVKYKKGK